MARPRQPPQQPAPEQTIVPEALAAVGLAQVAAGAAPGAVATTTLALTTAQVAQASAKIIAAMTRWARRRGVEIVLYSEQLVSTHFPQLTPVEQKALTTEEARREVVFRRKMRERLLRDLPAALRIEDPVKRRDRLNGILGRERQYVNQREAAMSERLISGAERQEVKRTSPLGAYWRLGVAEKHTPGCVYMAGKFWPWEVLDSFHPPVHVGCKCSLLTLDEAVANDLMTTADIPDTKDAIERAKRALELERGLNEAYGRDVVQAYTDWVLEANPRYDIRFPKGTVKGGEFRPRRGGSAARRLLRHLIPSVPTSPAERRRRGSGRWVVIGGQRHFIPEGRQFRTTMGGRTLVSPRGSTNVYTQGGRLVSWPGGTLPLAQPPARPGLNLDRIKEIYRQVEDHQDQHLRAANEVVEEALATMSPLYEPVSEGDWAAAAHRALEQHEFVVASSQELRNGLLTFYRHVPTGSELLVRADRDGTIAESAWRPGAITPADRPEGARIDRPPEDAQEFLDDIGRFVFDTASANGKTPVYSGVQFDFNLDDHSGMHDWYGTLQLGHDGEMALEVLAGTIDYEGGQEGLSGLEKRNVYATYATAHHEALHAASPIHQSVYQNPDERFIDEWLTEELAHVEAVNTLRRQGLDSIVQWAADHPLDNQARGSYHGYRSGGDVLMTTLQIAPESREEWLRDLKFRVPPGERADFIAEELMAHHGLEYDHARTLVSRVADRATRMDMGGSAPLADFIPQIRPDYGDVTPSPLDSFALPINSSVLVNGVPGRVIQVHQDPGFGVEYVADVATADGRLVHATPAEIQTLRAAPAVPDVIVADGQEIRPGDLVSYDGRADGGMSQGRVTRLIRQRSAEEQDDWVVEVETTEDSLNPGKLVWLTPERVGGQVAVEEPDVPETTPTPEPLAQVARPAVAAEPETHPAFEEGVFQNVFDGFRYDGLHVEVADVAMNTSPNLVNMGLGPEVQVRARIRDTDTGNVVGATSRSIVWRDGALEVVHDQLTIDAPYRGRGFAEALNRHAEEQYRELGVSRVSLSTSTVGGYAWARQDFRFDVRDEHWPTGPTGPGGPTGMRIPPGLEGYAGAALLLMSDGDKKGHPPIKEWARGRVSDDDVEEFLDRFPNPDDVEVAIDDIREGREPRMEPLEGKFQTPAEIAAYGRDMPWLEDDVAFYQGVQMWLGKAFMLGSNWDGVKQL